MKITINNTKTLSSLLGLALVFIGATLTTACVKEPTPTIQDIDIESEEYSAPTEDQIAVKSSLVTYIAPNVPSDGFGGALRRRLTNQVAWPSEDNIEGITNIVLHNDDVAQFDTEASDDLLIASFLQLLVGRNIIITEPTHAGFKKFCATITMAHDILDATEEGKEILNAVELDAIPGARRIFESFHQMSQDDSKIDAIFAANSDNNGVLAEAIAIRGGDFHIVERMQTGGAKSTLSHELMDGNGVVSALEDFSADRNPNAPVSLSVTAYSYGLVADMLTSWLNDHEYYYDDTEAARKRALEDLRKQSGETSKLSLDDIANVQKVEYTLNANSPYSVSAQLPVLIRFEICSVYMEKEDCDYYCIYKNIRSYNQVLECGPSGKKSWKKHENYGYYEELDQYREPIWHAYPFYGPFMRDITSKSICYAASEDITTENGGMNEITSSDEIKSLSNVRVEEYVPKNSVGSTTVSSGFSFGLDGGLSFGSDTSVSLGAGVSFDTSTMQTIDDLEIQVSTNDGTPTWKYIGHNIPQSHARITPTAAHDTAPSIMRNECEVDQSWIWRVANPTGSYCLYDETTVRTTILSYTNYIFYSKDHYSNESTTKRVGFLMLPPPRIEQVWLRDVQPYSEEVNALLGSLHEKYWNPNSYEFTLPDSSENSRISIQQYINSFHKDLDAKKVIWRNRGLVPANNRYIFSFYLKGDKTPIQMQFIL